MSLYKTSSSSTPLPSGINVGIITLCPTFSTIMRSTLRIALLDGKKINTREKSFLNCAICSHNACNMRTGFDAQKTFLFNTYYFL